MWCHHVIAVNYVPPPPFFSKIIFNILQVPESPVHHFFTIHDLLNRTIHESQGRGTAVLLTLNKLTLQLNWLDWLLVEIYTEIYILLFRSWSYLRVSSFHLNLFYLIISSVPGYVSCINTTRLQCGCHYASHIRHTDRPQVRTGAHFDQY